ncbi:MAG: hypothetical protein ACXWEJ_09265 [Actinomycetota bacterium]
MTARSTQKSPGALGVGLSTEAAGVEEDGIDGVEEPEHPTKTSETTTPNAAVFMGSGT